MRLIYIEILIYLHFYYISVRNISYLYVLQILKKEKHWPTRRRAVDVFRYRTGGIPGLAKLQMTPDPQVAPMNTAE
jgi:hypothetical protein